MPATPKKKASDRRTLKRPRKAARQRQAQNVVIAADLRLHAPKDTPFVLLFAEQKSVDVLKEAQCVFSEVVDGLRTVGAGDSPCTTFGGSTKGDGYDSAASLK